MLGALIGTRTALFLNGLTESLELEMAFSSTSIKRFFLAFTGLALSLGMPSITHAQSQSQVELANALIEKEKAGWQAWKTKSFDVAAWRKQVASDFSLNEARGKSTFEEIVRFHVETSDCSYSLTSFRVRWLSATVAEIQYDASFQFTFKGKRRSRNRLVRIVAEYRNGKWIDQNGSSEDRS